MIYVLKKLSASHFILLFMKITFEHPLSKNLIIFGYPKWKLHNPTDINVKDVVNDSGDEDEVVDSDGEVLGFENLVFAIFEFVHALVESPKFRVAVKTGLSDLMYYIVLYMQITHEQVGLSFVIINFFLLQTYSCGKWISYP